MGLQGNLQRVPLSLEQREKMLHRLKRLMPDLVSVEPTPWAIICQDTPVSQNVQKIFGCGQVYLTYREYMRQLMKANDRWMCPICGNIAEFVDLE